MEKVRPWCGQPSDRGRLKNRTEYSVSVPEQKATSRNAAARRKVDQQFFLSVQLSYVGLFASAWNLSTFLSFDIRHRNCVCQRVVLNEPDDDDDDDDDDLVTG